MVLSDGDENASVNENVFESANPSDRDDDDNHDNHHDHDSYSNENVTKTDDQMLRDDYHIEKDDHDDNDDETTSGCYDHGFWGFQPILMAIDACLVNAADHLSMIDGWIVCHLTVV